jgi:5'-3' exonuclease
MGVEKFFSSLKGYHFIEKYNKKLDCNHLLIDFNSIVHVLSQYLIKKTIVNESILSFEKLLIEQVGNYIISLLDMLIPGKLKTINIAIDGVPSMAKIYEQKKRRYMGDLIAYLQKSKKVLTQFHWSKNNISPGTDFMKDMVIFLSSKEFTDRIKKYCPVYKISGTDEEGEGEFKIIQIIDNLPKNESCVVYSPDSDMIILLLLVKNNCTMLRYDQQKSTYDNPSYDVIVINKFIDILIDYIAKKKQKEFIINKNKVINDLVFILTVFGDDFLPKLETVRVNTDINILIDFYIVCIYKHGYLLDMNKEYSINHKNFLEFIKLIQDKEDYFIKRNSKYHVLSNYHKLEKEVIGDTLYKIRDLLVCLIWKFIYLNKPKDIAINPINCHQYIDKNKFKEFLNSTEINVDYNLLNKFTKLNINRTGWYNIIESINKLISSIFIEILQTIDTDSVLVEYSLMDILYYIAIYFYNNYKLPFNVDISLMKTQLQYNSYDSNDNPHKKRLKMLSANDKDNYLIENKLDTYYNLLNPKDNFYYKIYKSDSIDYNDYYKEHLPNKSIKLIVEEYLKGLSWIVNYYHNRKLDQSWYYPYNRSPMLHDIINNFNIPIMKSKYIKLTPLQHFIFVQPFNINNTSQDIESKLSPISRNNTKNIVKFVKNNPNYYYDLSSIYNNLKTNKMVDCSSSYFLSKCHLMFMENYIDINEFIRDISVSL